MVAALTLRVSLVRIRESSMERMMVSSMPLMVAKRRKETAAARSCSLEAAITGPMRIRFSCGVSRPSSTMAREAIPKLTRSRVVRQVTI